eukprot:CAMPEP_0183388940 /NCGR_PEP_ID=MMETSP0370-20130417/4542_1 /TAXON_ID=268820 /ORGANISM="Peridinium aciculiferum, Strain PAER-2" /LENGTH=62 /DNA_ID=CAMNT_0025568063 /DNA_START=76 /DNA_END=261 /DNA_ORIENTATION=-
MAPRSVLLAALLASGFSGPGAQAADGSVVAYLVADYRNHRVQRCAPAEGGACTTVAGGNGNG